MRLEGSGWRCVWQTPFHLGEGTLWDGRDGGIDWLDGEAPLIRWFDLAHGAKQSRTPPDSVSALAIRGGGGFNATDGPAVSPHGRTFHYNDSLQRLTFVDDLGIDGSLSNRRTFGRCEAYDGCPDRMTCDSDGGVWIAFFQAHYWRRFSPDGRLISEHRLPVKQGTCPVFAGPTLDRLFISSATLSFTDHDRIEQPQAGRLFEVLGHGAKGVPAFAFAG